MVVWQVKTGPLLGFVYPYWQVSSCSCADVYRLYMYRLLFLFRENKLSCVSFFVLEHKMSHVRQPKVKIAHQQSTISPADSFTWQWHHAESDSPEAQSTSLWYTLQWRGRQAQHIHWRLALRRTNAGHPSVTITQIQCQNCGELQKTAVN